MALNTKNNSLISKNYLVCMCSYIYISYYQKKKRENNNSHFYSSVIETRSIVKCK